jgi:hypothetical protein
MSETELCLGTYCGITFAGIKAGSLVNIKESCFKCLPKYENYFNKKGFRFVCLKGDDKRKLMYVYSHKQLQKILFNDNNKKFLEGQGYRYNSVEDAVKELQKRMVNDDFPHEIGIFLNYPLEDVKGFITSPNEGVKCVGYWKVYEDEEAKKKTFELYDKCTGNIVNKLLGGKSLQAIFI